MPFAFDARPAWALGPLLAAATAFAQTSPSPAPPPAPAPVPAPAAPAAGERVEITGGRESDTEQRRQSTAAKIVIGREEIDKFGDATLGEVLRPVTEILRFVVGRNIVPVRDDLSVRDALATADNSGVYID